MRTSARWLLVVLISTGCATANRSATIPASNTQMLRSLYEAFGRGDVPAVMAMFDQNLVWEEAESSRYADGNPYRGPQAVATGVFQRLGGEWNAFRVTPQEFIDGGDRVVVLGRYDGRYKASGAPLNAQFVHVWTMRSGKVIRFQQFTDTAQFARVMGN